ncbi:hypothetical protein [Consotaella aegiceratis]|uniref:hypothetical protein n=1 Tax=Consotaella aegiceratis TaxID=3097961 RepID=UPI002F414D3B
MNAIPLAQYLSEFEQRSTAPFRPAKSDRRSRPEQPIFEHLSVVDDESGGAELESVISFDTDEAPQLIVEDAADHEPADLEPEPAFDIEAAKEKAFCDGRESMRVEMEAVFAETLAEERQRAAEAQESAIAEARREWIEEEATRMAERFTLGLERLESAVKSSLSAVLRPVATEARQQRTVEELIGAIRTMALDGKPFQIVASGPEDLLASLSERLGEHRKLVTFEKGEDTEEVRVLADTTIIETRLSAWRRALDEALS